MLKPSFALDFTTEERARLSRRLMNFSRNGVATEFDRQRLLRQLPANWSRFQVDPATGLARGLSVWGQETNSLLWNRDLSNAVWVNNGGVTITQNAVGLDGVANKAWTIESSDATASPNIYEDVSVPNDSNTHTLRFPIKKNSGDEANGFPAVFAEIRGGAGKTYVVRIDTRDGSTFAESVNGSHRVVDAGEYWFIDLTITNNTSGNTILRYYVNPARSLTLSGSSDVTATGKVVYDYGGVRLNSTFMGTPIYTEGSAVTRAAENATVPIGDEFNASGFGYVFDIITPNVTAGQYYLAQIGTAGADTRLTVDFVPGIGIRAQLRQGANLGTVSAIVAPNTRARAAISASASKLAISLNGSAVQSVVPSGFPTLSGNRSIGQTGGAVHLNSEILSIHEYPFALTDAQLVEYSTL